MKDIAMLGLKTAITAAISFDSFLRGVFYALIC